MTLPVAEGTLIAGKYVVEKVLGEGGMGVVVAARHVDLDQKVAIKFLLPHALADENVVARFAREARAAAKIQSPHVAKVMDVGRLDDGSPYMVMEYLEGEDLEGRLQRERTLPITEAVSIVLQACEALAEAHAEGIIHRDLKPANLYLARTPGRRAVVKVLDFGISKVTRDGGRAVTQTSSLLGTPYYMSPEQLASSKNIDARSDLWTLGVILYELIGGGVPFIADTMPGVVAMILQNQPTPLRELRSDCPDELVAIIKKCMATSPAARYRDVAELATALAPFGDASSRGSVEAITRTIAGSSVAPSPESIRKISSAPTIQTDSSERRPGTLDAAAVTSEVRGPKLDLVAEPSEVLPLVDGPEKKSNVPLFAVAAVALLVGGGVAVYALRTPAGPTAPTATIVATPPPPTTTVEPTATAPTTTATAPQPSASAVTTTATATTATAFVPTVRTSASAKASASSAPTASATTVATATATAPPTTTAVATTPPTTTTTATAKPSGNPVSNMGIK